MSDELRRLALRMADDAEHLVNILERRAEQEWNYAYQLERIAEVRRAFGETESR